MNKSFKCNLCSKELSSRFRLNHHVLSHHERLHYKQKHFDCSMCDYRFCSESSLISHVRTHTHERPFKCTVSDCGKAFKLEPTLRDHIKYKHSDKRSFVCQDPGCRFTAKTTAGLNQHKRTHSDDRPFPCPHIGCNFRAKVKQHLQNHIISVHSDVRAFPCSKCEYRAAHSYALKEHMRSHSTIMDFKCSHPKCTKSFKSSRGLKEHFSNRHGDRSIQCDHPGCGRKYASARALTNHKYSAHSKKSVTCPSLDCNYRTNTNTKLASHMILHDQRNEKISCTIQGCQFKGKNSRSVRRHMRRHETLFKCPVAGCARLADSKQALNNHVKSHSSVHSPFKCPLCFKNFQTRDHLKRHIYCHTNEKPFKCGHCEFGSFERIFVKKHISLMHANLNFPFIMIPLHDLECLWCKVTLPSAELLLHSMTHAVPIVMIERLHLK